MGLGISECFTGIKNLLTEALKVEVFPVVLKKVCSRMDKDEYKGY